MSSFVTYCKSHAPVHGPRLEGLRPHGSLGDSTDQFEDVSEWHVIHDIRRE